MSENVFDLLDRRGFVYQATDREELRRLLGGERVTFYIGYDPTAPSLHVGNLLTVMAAVHMQRAGHRVLVVVGGGTGLIGDPSGKTRMRNMLSGEEIERNVACLKEQLSRYLDFGEGGAVVLDNASWLKGISYIEFLRDVGVHFSVNKMLASESVKSRLERGLSFIEFNYALLQAYDFYVLARDYGCRLQVGGRDQWGNIVAGVDLIRRKLGVQAHGMTFPLVTDAKGEKFGKSVAGAVWLDGERLSPYEYYQFWRNVDDADVGKMMKFFTFLPVEEIERLADPEAGTINRAKEILAYEAVKITHGKAAAEEAYLAAVRRFGSADPNLRTPTSSDIVSVKPREEDVPAVTLSARALREGYWIVRLCSDAGLVRSNGEARRLIRQGGLYLDGERVGAEDFRVRPGDVKDGGVLLRAGKKRFLRVVFEDDR